MKQIVTYKVVFAIFVGVFFLSCKKSSEYNISQSGQLIGYVDVIDVEDINTIDNFGVEIRAEGISEMVTTSDKNGKFTFYGLKTGTYNISFHKEGFYDYLIQGYSFSGGDKPATLKKIALYSVFEAQIDSLTLSSDSFFTCNYITCCAKIKTETICRDHEIRYFLSYSSSVSYDKYLATSTLSCNYFKNDTLEFNVKIDTNLFPPSTLIYMIVYPTTYPTPRWYNGEDFHIIYYPDYIIDTKTGAKIYTTVNINSPSNVASLVIPGKQTN